MCKIRIKGVFVGGHKKKIIIAYYEEKSSIHQLHKHQISLPKTLYGSTWTSLYTYETKINHWVTSFKISCKCFPRKILSETVLSNPTCQSKAKRTGQNRSIYIKSLKEQNIVETGARSVWKIRTFRFRNISNTWFKSKKSIK